MVRRRRCSASTFSLRPSIMNHTMARSGDRRIARPGELCDPRAGGRRGFRIGSWRAPRTPRTRRRSGRQDCCCSRRLRRSNGPDDRPTSPWRSPACCCSSSFRCSRRSAPNLDGGFAELLTRFPGFFDPLWQLLFWAPMVWALLLVILAFVRRRPSLGRDLLAAAVISVAIADHRGRHRHRRAVGRARSYSPMSTAHQCSLPAR